MYNDNNNFNGQDRGTDFDPASVNAGSTGTNAANDTGFTPRSDTADHSPYGSARQNDYRHAEQNDYGYKANSYENNYDPDSYINYNMSAPSSAAIPHSSRTERPRSHKNDRP